MIKPLENALAKVLALPEPQQEVAAELLEQVAAASQGTYTLSDQERGAVREALERARAGEFASQSDTDAVVHKPWA